jgi:hypothetical protein
MSVVTRSVSDEAIQGERCNIEAFAWITSLGSQ